MKTVSIKESLRATASDVKLAKEISTQMLIAQKTGKVAELTLNNGKTIKLVRVGASSANTR